MVCSLCIKQGREVWIFIPWIFFSDPFLPVTYEVRWEYFQFVCLFTGGSREGVPSSLVHGLWPQVIFWEEGEFPWSWWVLGVPQLTDPWFHVLSHGGESTPGLWF